MKTRPFVFKFQAVLILTIVFYAATANAMRIDWDSVTLTGAKGVPDSTQHDYRVQLLGTIVDNSGGGDFSTVAGHIAVSGTGTWHEGSKRAEEKMTVAGDSSGTYSLTFQCDRDPWIYPAKCVKTSSAVMAPHLAEWANATTMPLSAHGNWLQQATQFSANSPSTPPPPPPPPQPGKSTVTPVKPLPTSPVLRESGPKLNPGTAIQNIKLTPDLSYVSGSARLNPNCSAEEAIYLTITVKNVGTAPLPMLAGQYLVYAQDLNGSGLAGGEEAGTLAVNEQRNYTVPVRVIGDKSKLAGNHRFEVSLNSLHLGGETRFDNNKGYILLNVPANHCKGLVTPVAPLFQNNNGNSTQNRSLNPQPEPPKVNQIRKLNVTPNQ